MPEIIYLESESSSELWMVIKYNNNKYTAIGLKEKYSLNNPFVKVKDNANKSMPPNIPLRWSKVLLENQVGNLDLIDKSDNIQFASNWNYFGGSTRKSLDEYTVTDLKAKAKARKIKNFSSMKKSELISALRGK
jgi:hypothetical protein